jgi:predicted lipoprotein with Yx(FWY)xxD motif
MNRPRARAVLPGDGGRVDRRGGSLAVRTTSRLVAGAAVGLLAVTGCGSSGGSDDAATSPAAAVLATADSDLGEIVVDAEGRTVYVFDRDTAGSGTSSCVDSCLANWPAVTADDETPEVRGVSGAVGTIERDDGTRQVTLDGLPLYTYAADSDPGDVTGQGVQGGWWVVAPDGAKVTETPAPPADLGY